MDRNAKIFLWVFIAILLISALLSFYRYMVLKDYEIVENYFSYLHESVSVQRV